MDVPTSPLVLTKLRVPAARPGMVLRPRLTSLLAPENGAEVILVCAPAGYGKTTLLAAWAQSLKQNDVAASWYALDPSDDDPIPFGAYLTASLIQALGAVPELTQIAQRLRASPELDLQRTLPDLINTIAACTRECVLILDDYHLIRSPAIHSAVAYLIEHKPENLRIAIGSRSDPPLPLARLRARGRLLEIRANRLRFTMEEAAQFIRDAMHLDLSPAGIAELEARTEGWIAGLQLASLAMQARLSLPGQPEKESFDQQGEDASNDALPASFTGSHHYLVEYLMEEVFKHQTEAVQSFFLSTAILERMCAPLCDALLAAAPASAVDERPNRSEAVLQQLEKANLFVVALDEQGSWYRYHHLFRDFLRARLNKAQPERVAALHDAASRWLAEHGFLREAAAHAFQTNDWQSAAAFVEQHSFTLIVHSEIATIYEWCSAFPEEVIQARPMLCILQALALAYNFRRQNRARVEARLQQANRLMNHLEDRQAAQTLMELGAVVRTFLAMAPDPAADPNALLEVADQMLGHYPENDPGQFSGLLLRGYACMALQIVQAANQALTAARQLAVAGRLYFGLVESSFHFARLAYSQGQLRRAAELCRGGQVDIASLLPQPEGELPALGCLDIALGCVLLEQDQLEEAEQRLMRGLAQMGAGMNPHYLMTAYLALFRLNEIRGRSAEAVKYLDRLEAAWPDMLFCTRGLRASHALRTAPHDPAALADAAAWCRDFSPDATLRPPGIGPFGAADAFYLASLTWLRVQIAAGNPHAAAPYLERQLHTAAAHGLVSRVIELSLLEAELAAKISQAPESHQRARAAIERALSAARPEGYIRVFDQGDSLKHLLAQAAADGLCQPYLDQVLAALGPLDHPDLEQAETATGDIAHSTPEFPESLTERELDVLRLMAHGATNQAIADQLVITVGTVKSHINHILGKLGAQNRTEAVARARESGLLKL